MELKGLWSCQTIKKASETTFIKDSFKIEFQSIYNPIFLISSSITSTSADLSSDIAASDFSVVHQKTAKVYRGI